MEVQKPMSNAPMILGIIGAALGLPSALCSGACAAGLTSIADNTSTDEAVQAGNAFMWIGLIGAILGLAGAIMYKKKPGRWGIILIFAGIFSLLNVLTLNMTALIPATLFIIAGAISLAQKKRVAVIA